MNRRLADRLTEVFYAPTRNARAALLREGARPTHPGHRQHGDRRPAGHGGLCSAPWEPRLERALNARAEGAGHRPPPGELGDADGARRRAIKQVCVASRGLLRLPHPPQPGGADHFRGALEGVDQVVFTEPLAYGPFVHL